jgi:3-isopropylmalate/(R)-2-methylmalate dehydratase small subunit
VIAPSFSDIFQSNAYKNGLLPLILDGAVAAAMRKQLHAMPGARITVDLPAQTVSDPQGNQYHFDISSVRKRCLLEGLDDIARTQQYRTQLDDFETAYRQARPWLIRRQTTTASQSN